MTRRTAPTKFNVTNTVRRRSEALRKSDVDIKYCTSCLVAETEQSVTFDEDGVCNICQVAQERDEKISWDKREEELKEIINSYRGKHPYDAIVPFSGGKDSAWTAYVLVRHYGLNVLLTTFDSNFRRPGHLQNLDRVVRALGCEHVTHRASQRIIKKTMLESLRRKGDFCWYCHTGVVAFPFKAALMYETPLIIWGEPGSEYSGGYYNYNTKTPPDERWFNRQINLSINAEDMVGFIDDATVRDLEPFRLPPWEKMQEAGVTSIHLGDYIKWDAPEQYKILNRELGWEMSEVENLHPRYHYEKVECFLQGTRDYLRFIKRGSARTAQRANLDIRNGILSREEAEEMIQYDMQRPQSLNVILGYLGISEDEFMDIALAHQIYPNVHDPEMIRPAQKALDDQKMWQERLVPDQDKAE